jgi:hypothetical protein
MADGASADAVVRDRLLLDCVVRIHLGELHAGSGFFAAPGAVVTCDHVLRMLELTTGAAPPDIRVIGSDDREYRVRDVSDRSASQDLAVLRVEPADHLCALLAEGLRGGDELVTFGSTQKRVEGVPTELWAEGLTGEDPQMMKLSRGQVQPGMSGSPVLNLRTGGVCGVLKRTRDQAQALGGYAIPIQALFRLVPTLERNSNRYHEADPTWFDALPGPQRRRMAIGRPGAVAGAPRYLIVTVKQSQHGWRASAIEHPGGVEIADVDVDLSAVRGNVARVFRYWGRTGRGDPKEETRRLGGILAAVLPDRIGDRFAELVDSKDAPLELVLRFDDETDPDLVHFPWENLYFARTGMKSDVFAALEDNFAFVRSHGSELREPSPPTRRGLDVLLIDVDSDSDARSDDEPSTTCVGAISDALEDMGRAEGPMTVERLVTPSATRIQDVLAEHRYDVVHYVGHGRFVPGDPPTDELAVSGTGEEAYIDASTFADALGGAAPTLVVLQLCESKSEEDMAPDLSTFAPPLVAENGAQAAIAYQFPLPAMMSKQFNEVLYRELRAGVSVEMAVQAARRRLRLKNKRSRAFLSPAIFMSRPGELSLVAKAQDAPTRSRGSALMASA